MINVYNFERSLKIKWLKRIISGQETDWQTLLCYDIKGLKRLFILGGEWSNLEISSLNPFWKTVFTYFKELCRDLKFNQIKISFPVAYGLTLILVLTNFSSLIGLNMVYILLEI